MYGWAVWWLNFACHPAAGSREPDLALPRRSMRSIDLGGPGFDKPASYQRGERRARSRVMYARLRQALPQPAENGLGMVRRVRNPPPVVSRVTAPVLVPESTLAFLGFLIGVIDKFEVLTLPWVQLVRLRVCRFFLRT
jgi:hypothetical protein